MSQRRLHIPLPRSIVARTSLSILLLALTLGLVFSFMAGARVHSAEQDRLATRVDELAKTVESTVSIACFLNDRTLAKEIANGLLKNRIIAGVEILSGGETLYSISSDAAFDAAPAEVRRTTVMSPFDSQQRLGELRLFVSHEEIEAQAGKYARYTTWVLGLLVAVVAAAVAFLVYLLVTRPIKSLSDGLHGLEVRSGTLVALPSRRRKDEIGQLVADVNALITRVSGLLNTERELRIEREISERRMRLVFDKADTGILVLDDRGFVQSANPAFARILGAAAAQPNANLAHLLAPHQAQVAQLILASRNSGQARDADFEIDAPVGRGKLWVELSVNPISSTLLQGLLNDISERKHAESAAHELAARDALTGLLNRRGFDAALVKQFGLASHGPYAEVALLLIDLDHFKAVNDTYGHDAGDRVLREVARVLERSVRRSDVVGRIGGDEFAVLLIGAESVQSTHDIANHIIAGVSQPIDIGLSRVAHIGASVGIAFATDHEESAAEFMRRCDAAMYAAKQAGRGQACFAMPPEPRNSMKVTAA